MLVLVAGALAFAVSTALSNDDGDLSAASTTAPAAAVTTVAPTVRDDAPGDHAGTDDARPDDRAADDRDSDDVVAVPQELIPGFAVPVDAEDFLRILEDDPDVVGKRGDDLAEGFKRLLEGPPGKRGDRREELRDDIERWSDDDELDPIIAAVAIHYIDELRGPRLSAPSPVFTRPPDWITFRACAAADGRSGSVCSVLPRSEPPRCRARSLSKFDGRPVSRCRRSRESTRQERFTAWATRHPCAWSHSATARSPVRGSPTPPTSGCVRPCTAWSSSRRSR